MSTLLLNSILRQVIPSAIVTDLDSQSHFRTTVMPVKMASPQTLYEMFCELWLKRNKPTAMILECGDIHAFAGSSILYLIRGMRAFSREKRVPMLLLNTPASMSGVIDTIAIPDEIALWVCDRSDHRLCVRGCLSRPHRRLIDCLVQSRQRPQREAKSNALYLRQLYKLGLLERTETISFHCSRRGTTVFDYVIPPLFLSRSSQWIQRLPLAQ